MSLDKMILKINTVVPMVLYKKMECFEKKKLDFQKRYIVNENINILKVIQFQGSHTFGVNGISSILSNKWSIICTIESISSIQE